MPELCFPLFTVRLRISKVNEREHMRQFVHQRYEKAVLIKVDIYAYPVILAFLCRRSVISQYAFALASEREINGVVAEVWRNHVKSVGRQKLPEHVQ